jgi:predicted cupin superfamily sugar epimerase
VQPPSSDDFIRLHNLVPHPEGGYYRQTYRSEELLPGSTLPHRYNGGNRPYSTAIYYLLREGERSRLHRLASDEVWHFYSGGALTIAEIHPNGRVAEAVLGPNPIMGQQQQYVVRAGTWFGAYPHSGAAYSFVGCTVAPGFDFADFEMGERQQLMKEFPSAREVIERLT